MVHEVLSTSQQKTAVVFPFFGFFKLHHSSKLDKSDSRFKPMQYTPQAQSKNADFSYTLTDESIDYTVFSS